MNVKYLLYFFIVFVSVSCSDDNEITDNTPEEQEEINPMASYTPLTLRSNREKKDLLGKGYDFTGSFINYSSTREQVIDIVKFEAELNNLIYESSTTESSNYTVSGTTAWQYSKSLTNCTDDDYLNLIPNNIAAYTGTFLDNETLSINRNDSAKYSFASVHFYFILKTFKLAKYDELNLYLTEAFKNDLKTLSTDLFIQKYGTHVILHYSIGARLDLIYRSKVTSVPENIYYANPIVQAGLRHTVNKIGYWINGPIDPPDETDIKKNKTPILYVENQGGDNSLIPCGTYNLQKQYPTINIPAWMQSLSENNAALIEMNLSGQIPIYDLIVDEQKKFEIKIAVEKYIMKRQQ